MGAVGHDVIDVGSEERKSALDPTERLLGPVHRWVPPRRRCRGPLHRVNAGVLVANDHPVSHTGRGSRDTHLHARRIRAEERGVYTRTTSGLERVEHLLRPILSMSAHDDTLPVEQRATIGVRVDLGRVGHVVPGSLEPPDELELPVGEVSGAVGRVGAIKRHVDSAPVPGDRVRPVAVVGIETLARLAVIGVVVVRLIRHHALLVEERRRAVVPDDKHHVVLVTRRIREERKIHAAGPVARDGQDIARNPAAGDQSRGRVRQARALLEPVEWARVETKATAQPGVPTHAKDINRVRLSRVDRHVEGDALVLLDARRRRISLDLPVRVVGDQPRREPPRRRARQLVLDNDRIVGGEGRDRRGHDRGCDKGQHGRDGNPPLHPCARRPRRRTLPTAFGHFKEDSRTLRRSEQSGKSCNEAQGYLGSTKRRCRSSRVRTWWISMV